MELSEKQKSKANNLLKEKGLEGLWVDIRVHLNKKPNVKTLETLFAVVDYAISESNATSPAKSDHKNSSQLKGQVETQISTLISKRTQEDSSLDSSDNLRGNIKEDMDIENIILSFIDENKYMKGGSIYTDQENLTKVLPDHQKHYLELSPDEKPLMALNSKSIYNLMFSGLVVTSKGIHYRTVFKSFWSGLIGFILKKPTGWVPFHRIGNIQIGKHDHCFGTAYVGHELILNNHTIGYLRMGTGVAFDDDAISFLGGLFEIIGARSANATNTQEAPPQMTIAPPILKKDELISPDTSSSIIPEGANDNEVTIATGEQIVNKSDLEIKQFLLPHERSDEHECVFCYYKGGLAIVGKKVPWYLSYWLLIPLFCTGIGIIPCMIIGFVRGAKKKSILQCPNCENIMFW